MRSILRGPGKHVLHRIRSLSLSRAVTLFARVGERYRHANYLEDNDVSPRTRTGLTNTEDKQAIYLFFGGRAERVCVRERFFSTGSDVNDVCQRRVVFAVSLSFVVYHH